MDRLSSALEAQRAEVAASLIAAREELEEVRKRERELADMITEAEVILGTHVDVGNLTLHEAIVAVLQNHGSEWMTTQEIAREVNRRRLYRKRDGSPVESNQIHARTKNYSHLFDKDHQRIRLRQTDEQYGRPSPTSGRSKYDPLRDWLLACRDRAPVLTFQQIASTVGSLPASAWKHQAWWANESMGTHVQAGAWLNAGYRVARVDQHEGWVLFERIVDDGTAGLREPRSGLTETPSGTIELDTLEGDDRRSRG